MRRHPQAAALTAGILALLAFAPIAQARVVVDGFGTSGSRGGEFGSPRGVAVNSSGSAAAAGTTYVVDSQNRIQRFNSAGAFERAWGENVAGRDERQLITLTNLSGGTFTLSFGSEVTAALGISRPGAPTAAQIQSALSALPSIGAGNVAVAGATGSQGPFSVRFVAALSGTDVPQLVANGSSLSGSEPTGPSPPSISVATTENGSGGSSGGFEICTAVAGCQAGLATATIANGGDLNNPQGIAVNQANGHVYVTEAGNRRVQEFDADGNFIRAWGGDVRGVNEIQTLTVNATGGEYRLSFGASTTGNVKFNASASSVQAALRALPPIGEGNVTVSGGTNVSGVRTYAIAFAGTLSGTDVPQLVSSPGTVPLSGGTASATVATNQTGAGGSFIGPEVCSDAAACKPGVAGFQAGQFSEAIGTPAVDSAGNVWVADRGNNRIQVFDPSGSFLEMLGGDVIADGAEGAGSLTDGSTTVSALTVTRHLFEIGQTVTAPAGIQAGTTILSCAPSCPTATSLTLSKAANATVSNQTLTVAPGAGNVPTNEVQTVTATAGGAGGVFTISFNGQGTAADLPFDASAATLQSKLEGLSTIGAGNVAASGPDGGPWAVEFKGTRFADTDVPSLAVASSSGALAVASANAYEVCTVAADCRAGAPGTAPGQFGAGGPGELAFDSGGNLYVLDPGGKRVQKFNPSLSSVSNFGAAALTPFAAAAPERLTASQGGTRLDFAVIDPAAANERQSVELDTTGALREASLAGAGLDNLSGLAANDASGAIYATTTSASPFRVLVLDSPLPDPALLLDAAIARTDSTATFTGAVDPKGGLVSCRFQYSTDQSGWTDVAVPGCGSLGPGGGAQRIGATATGLVPATHYFVRLAVSRPLVGGSTRTTGAEAFDTDGSAPVVSSAGAVEISNTSARIAVTIDPRNSQSSWVVQYGTTPSLGSTTAPIDLGAGSVPVVVSQVVSGLAPSTTYYFRVVASNLAGPSASATQSFTTRGEALPLPDDRGYEMVSPVEKSGGGALTGSFAPVSLAPDGEAIQFWTTSIFGTPAPVQTLASAPNVSWRTADGWRTKAAAPPICRNAGEDPTGTSVGQTLMMSPQLDQVMFTQPESDSCPIPPLDPAAPRPSSNLYRADLFPGPVAYDLLNRVAAFIPGTGGATGIPAGYSADFTHLVYASTGNQTPDSPAAGNFNKLYEWDHGALRLVSRDPAGNPFLTDSMVPLKRGATSYLPAAPNTVSADGSRIFFQAPLGAPGQELYMRQGGTATIDVSASECTSACGSSQADEFAWATPAGQKALFTSAAKLTDDDPSSAGANLYMYTHGPDPAGEPHNLTLLSRDEEPADQANADVKAVLGIGDDGDTVFFVANGQLVPGGPVASGPKVYRWRWNGGSPTVDYLTTLASADNFNWMNPSLGTPHEDERVTPDGRYLLIGTGLRLDPAADSDQSRDLYRWGEADGWLCVSCQGPGASSSGDATGPFSNFYDRPHITITDDGSRVFFLTPEALVPQDVNGVVRDIYEWHDGAIGLISSGTGTTDVKLLGPTPSGDDVFLYTDQRLVGWDTDFVGDIYDARVGGGFPPPPTQPPNCEGEACRGAATSALAGAGAGTAAFEGPGDRTAPASCRRGMRRVTVKGKVVCKKKPRKHHMAKQRHRHRAGGGSRGAGR